MRFFALAAALLLAAIPALRAQVAVEVVLDQDQFLQDESLPVKVRISNRSGQTLQLGKDAEWLSFTVASRDGHPVPRLGDPPVTGEFSLESAMVATRRVDLMPHFDFGLPGRYLVTATVRIKAWNEEISSAPKQFEIVRGTKIWEQEFGVPKAEGVPEVRKYVLQQAQYLKRLMLYVRLTDVTDTQVVRVLPAGPLVSFSRPEAQVDKVSNLHLLFQTGARAFQYLVITPAGEIIVRQTHDYAYTRPVLRSREDGRILVAGGTRRFTEHDLPPPAATAARPATNEVGSPKP